MSVSGLKAELKFLESIFDKDHERFRIVSWKLDELHCQFVLLPPPPGSSPQPPPPLTIHCNITVRGPSGAGGGPGHGPPSPLSAGRGEGAQPRRGVTQHRGGPGPPGGCRGAWARFSPGSACPPRRDHNKSSGAGAPGLSSPPRRGPGCPSGGGLLWGKDVAASPASGPGAGTKGGRARGSGERVPGPPPRRGAGPWGSGRPFRPPPFLRRLGGARGALSSRPQRWEPGREVQGERFTECATPAGPAPGGPPCPGRGEGRPGGRARGVSPEPRRGWRLRGPLRSEGRGNF